MKSRGIALVLALLATAGCDDFRKWRARTSVPRVVVVSLDTLHIGKVGPYNGDPSVTPTLHRIAAEGVRFEHAYTHAPITLPSHAALLTGTSPPKLGVMANGDFVPEEAETLAEIFTGAGYHTGAFISLGVMVPVFNLHQGFADFHDPFIEGPDRWYRRSHELIEPVKTWLDDNRDRPFFLWVHFSDPHEPYVTPDDEPDAELWLDDELVGTYSLASLERHVVDVELSPGPHRLKWRSLRISHEDDRPETGLELLLISPDELQRFTDAELPKRHTPLRPELQIELMNDEDSARTLPLHFSGLLRRPPPSVVLPSYEKNIENMDQHLGELLDALDETGARDDTLVVIVSDHGEGLFAHDVLGHASHVYEDQLRIVWMMRGAGLPEGEVFDDSPAQMMDVGPTILDIVGLPHSRMEGRSFVDCWESRACPEPQPFWSFGVSHETRGLTGMASYQWPYKWMWRRGFRRIAFDVESDPWEEADLLENPGPHNPAPLKDAAESFRDERKRLAKALRESGEHAASDETERLLESLGYVGGRDP